MGNSTNDFSTVAVDSVNNLTLVDANALILATSTVTGNLNITTGGAITQTGALTVTGTTTINAGAANNITLTNPANSFTGLLTLTGNNLSVTTGSTVTLGALTAAGDITLSATSGDILDGNGAATNLTAATATVTATTGILGTIADPIEISITGLITVTAGGTGPGPASGAMDGTAGTFTVNYASTPSDFYFNGVPVPRPVLSAPPAPVTGGATASEAQQIFITLNQDKYEMEYIQDPLGIYSDPYNSKKWLAPQSGLSIPKPG